MKAILFANTDWYLYNFRLAYAEFLKEKGWEVCFLSPVGEHVQKLEEAGFRHIAIEFSRKGLNPLQENETIRRIKAIYAQEKPDLVQQFTIKCDIYGSLAAKELGIRAVINTITGLGYMFLSDKVHVKLIREVVKRLYRKALRGTEVIFENPDDRRLFIEMGLVGEENSHIVPGTGIDIEKFIPVPPPNSIPLTILPSRMIWDKGVSEFVEAAKMIRESGVNARFALVGNNDIGNPTCIPFDKLTQWQKEGNVEWWGWQDDVVTVISMSHIICLPSYREGLPKILIEAASSGRPIVTTDVPGCREVVEDGVNGFLVPAKNAEKLRDALLKLIENEELRIKMGEESRKIAKDRFSNQIVNEAIYAVYQKAIASS
ncbi:MAG: glycosyltransferase family 4 protein [Flexilinea sp.]|nr:glycosyltransferase family 4 protein [Flexilinea sp.]